MMTKNQPSPLKQYSSQSTFRSEESEKRLDQPRSPCGLDKLLTKFVGKLSAKQVIAVYHVSDNDFGASFDCLLPGPTFSSIVGMLNN